MALSSTNWLLAPLLAIRRLLCNRTPYSVSSSDTAAEAEASLEAPKRARKRHRFEPDRRLSGLLYLFHTLSCKKSEKGAVYDRRPLPVPLE